MRLTVGERITLDGILPKEGNFVTLSLLRKLREALSFTEDEIKALSVEYDEKKMTWNPIADGEGADIEIGDVAAGIIRKALTDLDSASKLTAQHVSLYEKFVNP
ncbi:MAG: hypothetical protein WC565_08170 [Parcubacteria group bacterium]